MLKQRLKIFLKCLLLLAILLLAFLLFERLRGQFLAAKYRRQLIDAGDLTDLQKLGTSQPPQPDSRLNEFKRLTDLIRPQTNGLTDNPPLRLYQVCSNRFIVDWKQTHWPPNCWMGRSNTWEALELEIASNCAVLVQLTNVLAGGRFSQHIEYPTPNSDLPAMTTPCSTARKWLAAAAAAEFHADRYDPAYGYLCASFSVYELAGMDGTLMGARQRQNFCLKSTDEYWQFLQLSGWRDDQLATLQTEWQRLSFLSNYSAALQVECAQQSERMVSVWQKPDMLPGIPLTGLHLKPAWLDLLPNDLVDNCYILLWRHVWQFEDTARLYQETAQLLAMAREGGVKKSRAGLAQRLEDFDDHNALHVCHSTRLPFSEMILRSSFDALESAFQAETSKSMAVCAIALKRYQLRHGKPAPDLKALIPEFLSEIPTDYMDGLPMKYHQQADDCYILYSSGKNGRDEGGDSRWAGSSQFAGQLWYGRDLIWPLPASEKDMQDMAASGY